MPRWLLVVLIVAAAGLVIGPARAAPPPPPAERAEWEWTAVPVHHALDPAQARARPPHVPPDTPRRTGPVVVEPGRAVLVWLEAFGSVRVRTLGRDGSGVLTFARLQAGVDEGFARIEEPGVRMDDGTWWLRSVVGRGEPWLVESTRRIELVVERPVPRRGARIWEHVHDAAMAFVAGEGPLPQLPAVPGAERYLRRRLADRGLAEELRGLPGHDDDVERAVTAWRLYRASLELDGLRALAQLRDVRPDGAPAVSLPYLADEDAPDEPAEAELVRLATPWSFRVRGPSVLRLSVRALLPPTGPSSQPIEVVVTTRDDDGRTIVVARLDALAGPLRVRDPTREDEPIPVLIDAVADTGERVSKEHVLAVPLRPGRHEYRVESRRGAVAIRARLGRVLPRAHARDAAPWRERTRERALASLADRTTAAASVARALLADPWQAPAAGPEALALVPRARALLELEALARRDASAATRAEEAARIARRLARPPRPDPLDVELRVQAFEQLLAAGRPRAAVEALRDHARWLDGDGLPALVAAVEDPARLGPLEGALDVVAQRAPLTARLRGAYVRLWTWTRWDRLRPADEAPAWSWIEPASPGDAPAPHDAPAKLSRLPLGRTVQLDALPHPFERDRTPVLRVLALASAAVDGVLALDVDGQRFSAPMQGPSEVLEVAVPIGRHAVRLDAPTGVEAFASLPIVSEAAALVEPRPVLTTLWPARWNERPVRLELGALPRDTLAEVDVRVVGVAPGRAPDPVALWVCFDEGTRRRIEVVPAPASRESLAVTAPAASSARIRFVVPVPERATQLWIEPPSGTSLAVAAKLRRWELPGATEHALAARDRDVATPTAGVTTGPSLAPTGPATAPSAPGSASPDPYERLAESTRRIADDPASASLRLAHAHRLLDAGDSRRARRALVGVLERHALTPSDPLVPEIRALAARIDAFVDDDFVTLAPTAPAGPLLLRPAAAALDPGDPARAEALEADVAARDGRGRAAFERYASTYARTGALGPGYAAALTYAALLAATPPDRIDPELARLLPLVHGITTQLRRTLDTPKLRRLHHHAAAATRWEPQTMAEQSAGTRTRGVELAEVERTDAERLHWALLAPPFDPTTARLLRAGTRVVMELELPAPRELELEVFCDDLEPASPAADLTPLVVRTGSAAAVAVERTLATTPRAVVRDRLALPAGSVRVELALPSGREEQRCALRWSVVDAGASLPTPQRPKRWLLATKGSPVEVIVLGPTTLQLELAPVNEGTPAAATVELADLRGGPPRALAVTAGASSTLLVPEPGPRRVVVRTNDAELLVRLALRVGTPTEAPLAPAPEDDEQRDAPRMASSLSLGPAVERSRILWPAGTHARPYERIGSAPAERPSRAGAFEAALGYSRTDIPETDAPRPRDQVRGSLLWRRELVPNHVWLKLAGHSQWRELAGTAGGGGATAFAQLGPRRLRGTLAVAGWSERYAGAPAWSLHASLAIDRPIGLAPTVALVPFVKAAYVHQSLDDPDFAPDVEASHPQVYSPYLEDHPLALTPGARVRWFPLQDLQLAGAVSLTPNSSMASLDHVDADLDLEGIASLRVPLLLRYGGAYSASLRLADDDRDQTFLRHGPRLHAGLTYVILRIGRLNLDVHDTLYLARPFPVRNGVDVVASFELTLGRGIRDTAPMERLFRPQYRTEWWEPAATERAR